VGAEPIAWTDLRVAHAPHGLPNVEEGTMFQRALLKESDVEPLTDAVCRVLDEVGVLCQNTEILSALADAGARVQMEDQLATFPSAMVQAFVEGLRKEAEPEPADPPAFRAPGLPSVGTQVAQFVHDYRTKERRSGNRDDFIELTKWGDALAQGGPVGHALLLTDVPAMIEPMEAALCLAEYAHQPAPAFA